MLRRSTPPGRTPSPCCRKLRAIVANPQGRPGDLGADVRAPASISDRVASCGSSEARASRSSGCCPISLRARPSWWSLGNGRVDRHRAQPISVFPTAGAGLRPADAQLETRFCGLLPPGFQYPVVQVHALGETKCLRMGDARAAAGARQEAAWRMGRSFRLSPGTAGSSRSTLHGSRNIIVTVTLPVLGRVSRQQEADLPVPRYHGSSRGERAGGDDPSTRRVLLGAIRALVAVCVDLPPRLGRRDRRQRRCEPISGTPPVQDPAVGGADAAVGFA